MNDVRLDDRCRQTLAKFDALDNPPALDRPLAAWVGPSDKHLPQRVLDWPLRRLLNPAVWAELRDTPGIGPTRIHRLLDVLDRAGHLLAAPPPEVPPVPTLRPAAAAATEDEWTRWATMVRRHGLGGYPLGRFAPALAELPHGLWALPLRQFADLSWAEATHAPGYGPARLGHVATVLADVAAVVADDAVQSGLRGTPVAARLHDIAGWIAGRLGGSVAPAVADVLSQVVGPLLGQLALDLGADAAAMVARRWGVDGPAATLEVLGAEQGLTRERVRQLTAKAFDVLVVRWPEGKHALIELAHLTREAADAADSLALLADVLETGYGVELPQGGTPAAVRAAWDRAARDRLTPMDNAAAKVWLAGEFPHLPPERALGWLRGHAVIHTAGGAEWLFGREPLDALLRHLHARGEPVGQADIGAFVPGDERSAWLKVDRDPRFVEVEGHRVAASEQAGFVRRADGWHVRLTGAARCDSVAVGQLAHLIVGGLLSRGIADATVWGVRRCAGELVAATYGATLPAGLTPFALASGLTLLSDGLMRPMRRRRLRWDAPGGPPARGKRGWIAWAVTTTGGPITCDELRGLLIERYQDYEEYVFKQLAYDDDDEGDAAAAGYWSVPPAAGRWPKLYVPDGWRLNASGDNVSAGVRAVARGLDGSGDFTAAPWMADIGVGERGRVSVPSA